MILSDVVGDDLSVIGSGPTAPDPSTFEQAIAILGPYKELPEERRPALGNGKEYSSSLLAAAMFAAQNATSRDEFERLLGLHGSGYPSLLRS